MPGRYTGRSGRRWRRARALCLATSTVCHLCGHEGAGEADHHPHSVEELLAMGLDPDDPAWLKPAHGTHARCPDCGRACNQAKNARTPSFHQPRSREW